LLYWLGDMATLYAGLRAFGVHTSAAQIALAYTTGYVANLLPLPTGGVGGVDAAMTYALHVLGVPLDSALAGVIAYRFFGFWLPTIPAAWAFFTLPSLGRTLEHEYPDHEPQPSAA
jgi:glycosyltransferase 2 family protein